MFSVVVAGRLPLPPPQQVDETHALFLIEDAANINHVTVFMTGAQAFPPGYAATVHLNWRGGVAEDRWILLGCLKNEKPSSIYRLRGLTQSASAGPANSFGNASQSSAAPPTTAALGISIEPVQQVDEQMAELARRGGPNGSSGGTGAGAGAAGADAGMDVEGSQQQALVKASSGAGDPAMQMQMALALAPKIASSAFSYLSSFAPDSAPQTVPLLKRWLENFERKLKMQGLGFLEKSEAERAAINGQTQGNEWHS